MKEICHNISILKNINAIKDIEDKYNISFPTEMIEFLKINNGGVPNNRYFKGNDEEEYELRYFLSFNANEHNSIHMPIEYYQKQTKGKIAPFAADSFDNYFCIHLETGAIYFQPQEEELFYKIFESFSELIKALEQ